jgi:serine-type D-Ala-D-Ala carboxypeptidase (penicillin-binding protein 5/6)
MRQRPTISGHNNQQTSGSENHPSLGERAEAQYDNKQPYGYIDPFTDQYRQQAADTQGRPRPQAAATSNTNHRRTRSTTPRTTILVIAVSIAAALTGYLLRPAPTRTPASPIGVAAPATSAAAKPPAATMAATTAPAGQLNLAVPADFTVPGTLNLSWPDTGQSAIALQGVGTIATHGPVNTPVPIASVTKTMTAYLILHDHPLDTDQDGPSITVLASEADAYAGEAALNQSLVHVQTGEQLTERQALQALMLASADNIAQILGRWDAGSDSAFLTRMNATAAALGMAHTHFTDPSGYDPGTRSTATDLLTLAGNAMHQPAFAQIVDETSATIPLQGTITNYNTLLGTDGVFGIKTGSTAAAGGCLLFTAHHTIDGHQATLIGVVLGIPGGETTMLPNTMTAARDLLVSTEDTLVQATIAQQGTALAAITTGSAPTQLTAPQNLTITAWPGLTLTLTLTTAGTPTNPTLTITAPNETTLITSPLTPLT